MAELPIEYAVSLDRAGSGEAHLESGRRPVLGVGPPPEFGGTDLGWSPEHLLVAAVASCMMATYYAAAERARMPISAYACRAVGVLGATDRHVAFTAIRLSIEVRVLGGDVARARALVDKARERCFVASSLRCPVDVIAEVVALSLIHI